MTGHYLVLEGIEGAGKSSLTERLEKVLRDRGIDVATVREPGGTPAGEAIREVLLEGSDLTAWSEALLFAAQRAQLAAEFIRPALAAGRWVVADRSVYSSLAYQGGGRRLGIAAVRDLNASGLAGTWPEMVVLLRLDPAVGLARQQIADRIGREGLEFQRRVAAAYDRLAAEEPDRFVVIDAGRPFEEVVQAVIEAVEARW